MKWISVKDKLPEYVGKEDFILCMIDDGKNTSTTVVSISEFSSMKNVTHWMCVPSDSEEQ